MAKAVPGTKSVIATVEAGYAVQGTDAEWLGRVLDASRSDLESGAGCYGFVCRVANGIEMGAYVERALDPRFSAIITELNRTVPEVFFELLSKSAVLAGGFRQIAPPPLRAHFDATAAGHGHGIRDSFALFAQDGEGYALNLSYPSEHGGPVHAGVRNVWHRAGTHLAAGLRLRRRLQGGHARRDALLAPSGDVAHAEGAVGRDKSLRELLSGAVRRIERARSVRTRRDASYALDLWHGLVAGEWSLVDEWESDGKRYVAAYRNDPRVKDPRGLTKLERTVLWYAALGESNKQIAFSLGIADGTVASTMNLVLRKLRCKRRSELLAFANVAGAARAHVRLGQEKLDVLALPYTLSESVLARLSAGERDVVAHVVAGRTNAAIARLRGTSLHTVGNQVARIFAKLEVGSRTELVKLATSVG